MTSSVRRIVMSRFGLGDRGRSPLFTLPRATISSINSGSSSYSFGWMTCAATRAGSEPNERRKARLLSVIDRPHAEHVAIRATRGVADDDHAIAEHAEADDPCLAVVLTLVLDLECRPVEHQLGSLEIESAAGERGTALPWIVRDGNAVSVATSTFQRKAVVGRGV